jgi:multisubunit Na+/H+ antiporter MnhB subunit
MEQTEWLIALGLGALFLLLGIALVFGGRKEEKSYYDGIVGHEDVREFMVHDPERAEPGALKVGGWISLAAGLVMMAISGAMLIWG